MNVLMTLVADGPADVLSAHLAFHLNAGVSAMIVGDSGGADDVADVLEPYVRSGHVHRTSPGAQSEGAVHTEMARLAIAEHAVDWVIPSRPNEFWWPRGESLEDVLAVIPPRYAVVQALVRAFARGPSQGGPFFEEMTARRSFLAVGPGDEETVESLLRPVYRAETNMLIDPADWTMGGRRIPLRAWYPIEVFRFPVEPSQIDGDASLEDLVVDRTFVVDTRLRDALRSLRSESGDSALAEAARVDRGSPLVIQIPTIVDDASYAVECAAVGEVDLVRLDRQIRELDARIAALEARLWPTARRALRRLLRRRR